MRHHEESKKRWRSSSAVKHRRIISLAPHCKIVFGRANRCGGEGLRNLRWSLSSDNGCYRGAVPKVRCPQLPDAAAKMSQGSKRRLIATWAAIHGNKLRPPTM